MAVAVLILLIAGAAAAQYRRQAVTGPRAIGIIEWDAKGKARLVPVSILIDGRWYDAGLYKADPVPMALDAETVYEATQQGEPTGLFTVTEAAQLNGAWLGLGKWHEGIEKPKADDKAVDLSKPKAKATEEDDRPVLRRPSAAPKEEPKPENQPTTKPEAAAQKPEPAKNTDEDVERPVLRRNQGEAEQATALPGNVTGASVGKLKTAGVEVAAPKRMLVAISDAKHNDYRSFAFPWKPEEKDKLTAQMTDLAISELSAYAHQHPGALPASLRDVEVRAFDLDLVNEPELVLTARADQAAVPPAPPTKRGAKAEAAPQVVPNGVEFYVTVVARQDVNGDLQKLFTAATDSRHLDVYPRLQFIDAVDADGNSRGELLFREISDQGRAFVIYRVGGDRLYTAYDSSAPME